MLVKNFGIEADLLLGREGIEHAADGIHFARDGFGGAALRALEDHVLHKVGETVFLSDFAPDTPSKPDARGEGGHCGGGRRDPYQAGRENVLNNLPPVGCLSYYD